MTMRPAGRIALALAALLAAASVRAQETPAPPAEFSIATYNINYANADLRGVARTIRESGADLVVLQETNRSSEAHLRRELKDVYPHRVFHHVSDRAGGFGLLSKTPPEKARYLPPLRSAGGWFGTQTARVTLAGREMLIVNVHLTATVPTEGMNTPGVLTLFARTEAVRDKEIRAIVGALPKRWPVCILGDFNSIPKLSGVPEFMAKSGFTDCLAEVVKDADGTPTWRWKRAGENYRTRLDYIFAARLAATAASGKVVEGDASDHSLVTCSFRWLPVPVRLADVETEAVSVVYLLDTAETTAERAARARELVATSIDKLAPTQNFSVVTPGPGDTPVAPELSAASEDNRKLAAEALSKGSAEPGALLPALPKAAGLLDDEAAPKALFILSDRLAKDPEALKASRALHADRSLRLYLLDAEGKPVADAEK